MRAAGETQSALDAVRGHAPPVGRDYVQTLDNLSSYQSRVHDAQAAHDARVRTLLGATRDAEAAADAYSEAVRRIPNRKLIQYGVPGAIAAGAALTGYGLHQMGKDPS